MTLLRDWRRRTFGAAAGAAIVPVAVTLAALAVGVGGGGLGGVRSLGQAVTGPTPPTVAPVVVDGDRTTADEAGRLLARVRVRPRGTPSAASARAPATGTTGAAGQGTGAPAEGGPGVPQPTQPPVPAPSPPAPAPTAAPTPTPTATPSPIRQVGDEVKSVTDQVPVAGPPAGEVVDLLVDTIDQLPRRAGG